MTLNPSKLIAKIVTKIPQLHMLNRNSPITDPEMGVKTGENLLFINWNWDWRFLNY